MALLVQTPYHEGVLRKVGSYSKYVNIVRGGGTAVQRKIHRYGLAGYEKPTQSTLLALMEMQINKRPVFYDVGAHIGLYSALIGTVFKRSGSTSVAFEPTPTTAAKAIRLRDANKLNYHIAQFAAGSEIGETKFFLSTKAETSNSINSEFRPGSPSIQVKMDTIDNYVERGAPPPGLMKIDVETYESHTISGAKGTISKFRPWIVCEILPESDDAATADLYSWFSQEGYAFFPLGLAAAGEPVSLDQLLSGRTHRQRDWIIAPAPLPADFEQSLSVWSASVGASVVDTNIILEDKAKIRSYLRQKWKIGGSRKDNLEESSLTVG